jgi:hypothetical protein
MPQALSNAVKGHGYQTLKTIAFNGLANTFTRLRNTLTQMDFMATPRPCAGHGALTRC